MINGEDQRKITKVYIGSFLDITLKDQTKYLPIFKNYRKALSWLPNTYYINRYQDGSDEIYLDFEEDIDLTTSSHEYIHVSTSLLSTWKEYDIGFRNGSNQRQNKGVYIGWNHEHVEDSAFMASHNHPVDTIPYYEICFNTDSIFSPGDHIIFAMTQIDEEPEKLLSKINDKEERKKKKKNDKNEDESAESKTKEKNDTTELIDFTIKLKDQSDRFISKSIQDIHPILPPFKAKFTRYKPTENNFGKSSEPVLQSVRWPINEVIKDSPFDIHTLRSIRLYFNQSKKGVIILDEVGRSKAM